MAVIPGAGADGKIVEVDLEEILSKHGLTEEELDKKCSSSVRYKIATEVINWKMLGYYFGFPEKTLVAIQRDYENEEERRVVLLNRWHTREGIRATNRRLIHALYHRERRDLMSILCLLIKSESNNGAREDHQHSINSREFRLSVEVEIQELESLFDELYDHLRLELLEKQISVEALLNSLTRLPISFKREYENAIKELVPEVEKEKTIPEFFFRLNPIFTFIDYNLLQYLVSKFGSEELKHKMTSYVANIKMFMKKTTVGELMDYWPGDEVHPEHFSKICAKISDDPKTYTLEKLDQLRKKICSMLRLSEVLFNLVRMEASKSFIAVWLIPKGIVSIIMKLFSNVDDAFYREHHILMISLNDAIIYTLEDKDVIDPVHSEKEIGVSAIGPGLQQAYTGIPAQFIILAKQEGLLEDGTLKIKVKGAINNVECKVRGRDRHNGSYNIAYLVPSPGAYLISIIANDQPIPGSPFRLTVLPGPTANKCHMYGPILQPNAILTIGNPMDFSVDTSAAGVGTLSVKAIGPGGTQARVYLAEANKKGIYNIKLDPVRPGKYRVSVKWSEDHIPGSPFKLKVYPGADASKCKAYGPGLEEGLVGQESFFVIETRDAGAGTLKIHLHRAFKFKMAVDKQDVRTLIPKYKPTEPGEYYITIKWSDKHIPGSPFPVKIMEEPGYSASTSSIQSHDDGENEESIEDDPEETSSTSTSTHSLGPKPQGRTGRRRRLSSGCS